MEFATDKVVKVLDSDNKTDEIPNPCPSRIGKYGFARELDAWRHVKHMIAFSPVIGPCACCPLGCWGPGC